MAEELARVAVQTAEKMATETQKGSQGPLPSTDSNFSQILMERLEQQQEVSQKVLQAFGLAPESRTPIQSVTADGIVIDPAKINEANAVRTQGQVYNLLGDVNRGALQMENIMEMATSGRSFSPPELLAMQAGIYSIVQEIELTSKVFEGLNTAQKQLVNTNIA